MKPFVLFSFFAIGMFIMWPPGEQVKAATTDQVSFVVEQSNIAQAMNIEIVPQFAYVAYQSQLAPVTAMVQEKGGYTIEKSINTSLVVGYGNKSQKFIQKNIVSVHRFPRDGLTQV